MMKINTKDHEHLVEVYDRYKEFHDLYGNITVSEEQNETIRQNALELQGMYDYYSILILELEKCIQNYNNIQKSLKKMMYNPVRKMNTIQKNRKQS